MTERIEVHDGRPRDCCANKRFAYYIDTFILWTQCKANSDQDVNFPSANDFSSVIPESAKRFSGIQVLLPQSGCRITASPFPA